MNLKELSQLLSLSQTTVSRALNGYPEVGEATRARVKAAAKAHNYSANTGAQRLATGRSKTIGHILPVTEGSEMVNPIFADFLAGASEAYALRGYDLLISRVRGGDEKSAYQKLVKKGVIDGIVVQGPRIFDRRLELLNKMDIPFVVHGRSSDVEFPYSWVDVNNRNAFKRATKHLIDLGHKRIALVNGIIDFDFATRRQKGYFEALSEHNIALDQDLIRSDEMTEVFGHHSARDLIRSNNPPTAFVVSSLISAIGIRRAIEEADLKVGRDISIVTHDDDLSYLKNGQEVPIFTATRSSVRLAGQIAAEMLIEQIENPDLKAQSRLLEAELIVGRSTGPFKLLQLEK